MSNAQEKHYYWHGKDSIGKRCSGKIKCINQTVARIQLRQQGIRATKIRLPRSRHWNNKPITAADIAVLLRQLATLTGAGIALLQALEMLGHATEKPRVKQLASQLKSNIESGNTLAESLAQHPKQFDRLLCQLVAAGEQSGTLETMLNRIAHYKEKTESLKRKIKKALLYPCTVVIIAILVSVIMLVFVVPKFESLFQQFGAQLPWFTQKVIHLSNTLQHHGILLLGISLSCIFLLKHYRKRSKKLALCLDRLLLNIPNLKRFLQQAIEARFARTLATTLAAGVPLLQALDSVAGVMNNRVYTQAVSEVRLRVAEGETLSFALKQAACFSSLTAHLVETGEASGALDTMLSKVADTYEEAVDHTVDSLSSLMEPVIMVVLGLLVGGLVIALYLPIFQLGSVI